MTEPSVPAEVLPSEEEADRITAALKAAVEVAGAAVGEVERLALIARDRGVWKVKKYASWNDYAEAEIGWSKRHANRMIRYAKFAGELAAAGGTTVPNVTENQTRNLTDEQRSEVVSEVKEATAGLPKKKREKVAAEVVQKATANFKSEQVVCNLAGDALTRLVDLAVASGVTRDAMATQILRSVLETGEVPSFKAGGVIGKPRPFAARVDEVLPAKRVQRAAVNVARNLDRREVVPNFKGGKK